MALSQWFLVLLAGLGILVSWVVFRFRAQVLIETLKGQAAAAERDVAQLRGAIDGRERELMEERKAAAAAREEAAGLRSQLAAERSSSASTIQALSDVQQSLKKDFELLAAQALDANVRHLMTVARSELQAEQREAKRDFEIRESTIHAMLGPMQESLRQLSAHSHDLEVKREGAYEAMLREVAGMQRSHLDLRRETTQLVQALRAPKARGTWGEMQLRRCVEHAGMVEHASFDVQRSVRSEESVLRPDLVVKLPNGRCIVVDAKTPMESFLTANATEDQGQQRASLDAHARSVRKHLDDLAGKAYWRQFPESPDFVVCFLPSEVLFSAALEQDPSLLEHSAATNVLLATPTTLIALLKAVACGWQQAQIARDAQQIRQCAEAVQSKLAGMHLSMLKLGDGLRKAGDCYDDMLTKAEGKGGLFSVSRKLRELKIGEKDLPEVRPAAVRPKPLQSEDWQQRGLSLAAAGTDDD